MLQEDAKSNGYAPWEQVHRPLRVVSLLHVHQLCVIRINTALKLDGGVKAFIDELSHDIGDSWLTDSMI